MPYVAPLSSRAIAAEIRAGRMTPQQAFKLGNSAINAHETRLGVFTHRAKSLAAAAGPLSGITIGVKDLFDTYDMPTAYGSKIYQGHRPAADASLVSMLRRAGATMAGKTVTTEFAWFSPGPTRNPHNVKHTPGGSSSGSAAGVAAGFFPAAIGSQTGGSIIRPAAFCGVAGYKPSFRLFPTVGMKQFSWSLDTVGLFAATVADAAFIAAACSGRQLEVTDSSSKPPRIGIYRSTIDNLMDDDMVVAIKQVTRLAKAHGAPVVTVKGARQVEAGRDAHGPIQDFEARLALADEFTRSPDKLTGKLRSYLKQADKVSPEDYDNARRTANRARKASHSLFEKCDVLLMPSAPGTAPRTLRSTGDSSFNRLWTLMGLPCVNVPGMSGTNGLPLGLQIVAPFGKDQRALQAAHWLENLIAQNGS